MASLMAEWRNAVRTRSQWNMFGNENRKWVLQSQSLSFVLHAKSLQACLALCDPVDCSLPGFSVHGILQARILEWVAMPSLQGDLPHSGQTWVFRLPHWQAGSFPLAPPGKRLPSGRINISLPGSVILFSFITPCHRDILSFATTRTWKFWFRYQLGLWGGGRKGDWIS